MPSVDPFEAVGEGTPIVRTFAEGIGSFVLLAGNPLETTQLRVATIPPSSRQTGDEILTVDDVLASHPADDELRAALDVDGFRIEFMSDVFEGLSDGGVLGHVVGDASPLPNLAAFGGNGLLTHCGDEPTRTMAAGVVRFTRAVEPDACGAHP